jgi:hypothetical protein
MTTALALDVTRPAAKASVRPPTFVTSTSKARWEKEGHRQ